MQIKETILVGLTTEEDNALQDLITAIELLQKVNLATFTLQDLKDLFRKGEVDVMDCHFEIDVNYNY